MLKIEIIIILRFKKKILTACKYKKYLFDTVHLYIHILVTNIYTILKKKW